MLGKYIEGKSVDEPEEVESYNTVLLRHAKGFRLDVWQKSDNYICVLERPIW